MSEPIVPRVSVASVALALVGLLGIATSSTRAEEESVVATGWNSPSSGDFFDTENWNQGEITGEFGSGLGSGKVRMQVAFGQDWTGNLTFTHANEAFITLYGDGMRDATWFVPGNVVFNSKTGKGKVNFGSQEAGRKFFIDLGGKSPTFTMKRKWTGAFGYFFYNAIRNGTWRVIDSSAPVGLCGDMATVEGDVFYWGGLEFQFDSSPSGSQGVTRTKNFEHGGYELKVVGNGKTDTTDTIDGSLRILGDTGCLKLVSVYAPSQNTILRARKLEIQNGAFVGFRGNSLGQQSVGTAGANILFDETPEMIGGVIPQAVALASFDGIATSSLSLATYDAEKGVRSLDFETEFVSDSSLLTAGTENLLVPHGVGAMTIAGAQTVNAVLMRGGEAKTAAALAKGDDAAKLYVTSGQFVIGYSRFSKPDVNVPVDFGVARGCISFAADKASDWNAPISGSEGVVFATFAENLAGSGLYFNSDCDYTGNTFVNASLYIKENRKVFPYGSREGDLYVRGNVGFWGNSSGKIIHQTVNGLNGNGTVRCVKYTVDFTLGDNDADGDFTGTVSDFRNVTKVGTGLQRLGGAVACKNMLNVNAGTVMLDGTVTAGTVNVAEGAALGGSGAVETSVNFAANAKFRVEIADGKAKGPLTVAALSAEGEVLVEADSDEWKGAYPVLKVTEGTLEGIAFRKGANVGALMLSDDGTELFATKRGGFAIIIR